MLPESRAPHSTIKSLVNWFSSSYQGSGLLAPPVPACALAGGQGGCHPLRQRVRRGGERLGHRLNHLGTGQVVTLTGEARARHVSDPPGAVAARVNSRRAVGIDDRDLPAAGFRVTGQDRLKDRTGCGPARQEPQGPGTVGGVEPGLRGHGAGICPGVRNRRAHGEEFGLHRRGWQAGS